MQHNNTPEHNTGQAVPIRRADGKIVGQVCGDAFRKTVSGSKHFLRRPPAIAVDVKCLRDAQAAGAVSVEITDRDTGKVYIAPVDRFWRRGFKVSRGFGEQIALILADFNIPDYALTPTSKPTQVALFKLSPYRV